MVMSAAPWRFLPPVFIRLIGPMFVPIVMILLVVTVAVIVRSARWNGHGQHKKCQNGEYGFGQFASSHIVERIYLLSITLLHNIYNTPEDPLLFITVFFCNFAEKIERYVRQLTARTP